MKNFLVVIQCGFPWDWVCDFEQQTARILSKHNVVIAFFPEYGVSAKNLLFQKKRLLVKVNKNLYCFYPFYLFPFMRIRLIHRLNLLLAPLQLHILIYLLKLNTYTKRVMWYFPFQHTPLPRSYGSDWFVVYDRVDYVEKEDQRDEKKLIQQSNLVFTTSPSLVASLPLSHPHTHITPLGFDHKAMRASATLPKNLSRIPQPWIVYVGNINERLDYAYLTTLIKKTKGASFLFVGPITQTHNRGDLHHVQSAQQKLFNLPNVYKIPKLPRKDVGAILRYATAGLIPYDTSRLFNRFSFPMKVMEYFYIGLPVVTTNIDALTGMPDVFSSNNPRVAANTVNQLLKHPVTLAYKKRSKDLALQNTWEKKLEAEARIIRKYF